MEKIKDFLSKLGLFKLVKYFLKRPYYTYRRIHFHKYSMLIFQESCIWNFIRICKRK